MPHLCVHHVTERIKGIESEKRVLGQKDGKAQSIAMLPVTPLTCFTVFLNTKDLLIVVNNLCQLVSTCNNEQNLFPNETGIKFAHQANFVCLLVLDNDFVNSNLTELLDMAPVIKQKTPEWFSIWRMAKVAGSTIMQALLRR